MPGIFEQFLIPVRIRLIDLVGAESEPASIIMYDVFIVDMQSDPVMSGHLLGERYGMIPLHFLQVAGHVERGACGT
jgi:hypothetical protein